MEDIMGLKKSVSAILTLCIILFASFTFAQELTDNIVVDQFGYREQARKIAVIRVPQIGPDAPSIYNPGTQFQVINSVNGNVVHTGAPVSFRGGETDAASGDRIWHFDFSAVTSPGRYYVLDVTNNVRSFPFDIANGVYDDVLRAAVKYFYYQRAGVAKLAQYAGEDWADGMQFEQDRQTRDWFNRNDRSRDRDLSGAWYDAGDYNKYTKWTSDYISEMLLMYEENPAAFSDDYGIPESGNGVPDILDEVVWGLNWLLRMQNDDGSMLSVQGLAGGYGDGTGSPPSRVTAVSYYGPPNATATFGAVRAFAIASRVFGDHGAVNYAERLKTAAVKAWEWGIANPDSMFSNNTASNGSAGLAAGNQEIIDNEHTTGRVENMVTAAWFLYELTEDPSLLQIVEDNLKRFPLFAWWQFMDQYRHSSHMLYMRYINDPRGSQALKNEIRSMLIAAFTRNDDFNSPNGYASDGYRAFMKAYPWGSNRDKGHYGLTFYKWHSMVDQTVDANEFRERAEGYLHYIHGVNPFNMVYLTNMITSAHRGV